MRTLWKTRSTQLKGEFGAAPKCRKNCFIFSECINQSKYFCSLTFPDISAQNQILWIPDKRVALQIGAEYIDFKAFTINKHVCLRQSACMQFFILMHASVSDIAFFHCSIDHSAYDQTQNTHPVRTNRVRDSNHSTLLAASSEFWNASHSHLSAHSRLKVLFRAQNMDRSIACDETLILHAHARL